MLKQIAHVGLTISDMEKSLAFYKDILGLKFQGEIIMEGKETDLLFQKDNVKARVCYLNGSEHIMTPPVELICFLSHPIKKVKGDLFTSSISELCFIVDDIERLYKHLLANNVKCLSAPQEFDFTKEGMSKSKAIYFKDPDGIILEAMEYL